MRTIDDPTIALAQRIRGLEMPWNRVLGSTAGPAGAATALGPWHPQEFTAECVETIPEAGDMMTFVFRRTDGAPLAFRSGQYVNIDFPIYGAEAEPESRSYSLVRAHRTVDVLGDDQTRPLRARLPVGARVDPAGHGARDARTRGRLPPRRLGPARPLPPARRRGRDHPIDVDDPHHPLPARAGRRRPRLPRLGTGPLRLHR